MGPVRPMVSAAEARRDRRPGRPRTAYILSGGASVGAPQAGMLEALCEQAIATDVLVATTAGALNAAYIASRVPTAAPLARVWRDLRREDVVPVSLSAPFGGGWGRRDHLVPAHGLRRLMFGARFAAGAALTRLTVVTRLRLVGR